MITHTMGLGQRLRVTLLEDIIEVDQDVVIAAIAEARQTGSSSYYLPTKIVTAAGTRYEGTVVNTMGERFALRLAGGQIVEFDAADPGLFIQEL